MSLTNAEKGRKYGKQIAEYKRHKFGVVGELRYNSKNKTFAITIGDVAVVANTQAEAEKAMVEQLDSPSVVKWYKIIRVNYKSSNRSCGTDYSGNIDLGIKRDVIARMPNKELRSLSLREPSNWERKQHPETEFVTVDEVFSPDFEVTNDFAMNHSYSNYGYIHDMELDSLPHTEIDRWDRYTSTIYMPYTPDAWDKLKLMCETIQKANEQIARLIAVDEELGYSPLLDMHITMSDHFLLSGGEDGSEA